MDERVVANNGVRQSAGLARLIDGRAELLLLGQLLAQPKHAHPRPDVCVGWDVASYSGIDEWGGEHDVSVR